jgi:hypothetical protein
MVMPVVEHDQRIGPVTAGLVIGVGLPVAGWFAIGPDHVVYAVVVQGAFLLMALLIGPSLVDVNRSRYKVRKFEALIYTLLGAEALRRVLDFGGWNRAIKQMRQEQGAASHRRQSGRDRVLRGTEQSETGHFLGITATGALSLVAVLTSHPVGALQILLVGVILHLYPVMIQRLVRSRLTRERTDRTHSER